ncbi:dihydrofolate reductase family protein [Glaciihabitans sp. UYNi722]|uniref:dihydrofolate reductase family protein n=1 Tax=Glaciihabitans sp. UYNi722 TaxID=3156344 RepID=UPI0033980EDB
MTTQYYTATSLDGYLADAENSLDWLLQFGDGSGDAYEQFIADVGAVVMGSTTYEWILNQQVLEDPDHPTAWVYLQPTWVFSSREQRVVEGADIRFVRGDVAAVHADMAAVAVGKNIWIVGGGDLAGQFHDRGLLDELIIWVAPVTLGSGAPLLPRSIVTPPMTLTSVSMEGPFAQLRYAV